MTTQAHVGENNYMTLQYLYPAHIGGGSGEMISMQEHAAPRTLCLVQTLPIRV